MKRCAVTIMVCLLLGAIINVAVAWGFVLWTPAMPLTESRTDRWLVDVPSDWPPARVTVAQCDIGFCVYRQRGSDHDLMRTEVNGKYQAAKAHAQAIDDPTERAAAMSNAAKERERTIWNAPFRFAEIDLFQSGWPVLSMFGETRRCETHSYSADYLAVDTTGSKPGVAIPARMRRPARGLQDRRDLPIYPIPLGFAVNTVFYGGPIALVVWAWAYVRRRYRVREGCCTACGYDLRGAAHARCPECGAPTTTALAGARQELV